MGNTSVEIIMQRIRRAQVFQTCLGAVSEYMQSMGLDTVTGCCLGGLDNAAVH